MTKALVCPSCRDALKVDGLSCLICGVCGRTYSSTGGYWNLTDEPVGSVSPEGSQEQNASLAGELASGRRFVQRYLLPKLESLQLGHASVLSVGCGVGEDVAELRRQGYEAFGVELWGLRASKWAEMERSPQSFCIANAVKLPFEDKTFDVVLCIGLIEHIGAVGASSELNPDWKYQRERFLKEMLRVARCGVLLETPNRTFPADFGHIATRNKLFLWLGRRTGVYIHSPFQPFYLSYRDIEGYLADLPVSLTPWELSNYFGFAIRRSHPWARLIVPFISLYLRMLDKAPIGIRKSWLNPWMAVFINTGNPGTLGTLDSGAGKHEHVPQ